MTITVEQALALLAGELDRPTLETYVAHAWVRPLRTPDGAGFEEIDIARIRLVRHLQRDLLVNDSGLDVALHLLDQLYELRRHYELYAAHDQDAVSTAEFWEEKEEF